MATKTTAREELPWSVQVTWFRATAARDIVIPYPDPKPPTIYPSGTVGWWRPTSERWGTFIPDIEGEGGVSMANGGLAISDEYQQVTYRQPLPVLDEVAA